MKKILFVYTDNFTVYDIAWAFLELGYEMDFHDETMFSYSHVDKDKASDHLFDILDKNDYWFVLSYNHIIEISEICAIKKIPYVSWTYDSLTLTLHTEKIKSPYNFTYVFDSEEYNIVRERFAPPHLYYMPLAANISRLGSAVITEEDISRFNSDISFIGNLYTTDEYQKLENAKVLPSKLTNYIDYLFDYYVGRWDSESIYDCFDEETCSLIDQVIPSGYRSIYDIDLNYYYAMILLSRRIANKDRLFMLKEVSKVFNLHYFGPEQNVDFPLDQHGKVDYFKEFSKAANLSKINLHLTIPRIPSGVSQRCFDVMASGGFLMCNYRRDMVDLFEPNEDFVMFESIEELIDKARYYLSHDKERQEIAQNGYQKVVTEHNIISRATTMINNLNEAGF